MRVEFNLKDGGKHVFDFTPTTPLQIEYKAEPLSIIFNGISIEPKNIASVNFSVNQEFLQTMNRILDVFMRKP